LGRGLGRGGQSSFHILLLGLTFKPNVPDTRNSKSQEVVKLLEERGCIVTTHDPYHSESSFQLPASSFDAILLLVPHKEYIEIPAEKYAASLKENSLFFDLKSIFSKEDFEDTGKKYLSL
jgi:UDP-N-acetyl-D-glucosamine/UDP-N-acetyl-D-galactosamine dehydrogenase